MLDAGIQYPDLPFILQFVSLLAGIITAFANLIFTNTVFCFTFFPVSTNTGQCPVQNKRHRV
jgi:hypothetical protein